MVEGTGVKGEINSLGRTYSEVIGLSRKQKPQEIFQQRELNIRIRINSKTG